LNSNSNQPGPDTDDRSSQVKALDLASRITSISVGFVLPILGGVYLDRWLETRIVFLLLGVLLGMALGGLRLAKLVSSLQTKQDR
jgi:F0F1-type ATP synthase assembly protein I